MRDSDDGGQMILMQERQEAPIEIGAAEDSGLDDTSHRNFEGALAEALLFARRTGCSR